MPTDDNFNTPEALLSAFQYFMKFFDNYLLEMISYETNLYSVQETGVSINTSPQEIKSFVAIQLLIGIVKMASYKDYWANLTRYNKIAVIIPLKRYMKIRTCLQFHDNSKPFDDRIA